MAVDEAPVEESAPSPFMQGESKEPEPEGGASHAETETTPHNMPPLLDSTPAPVLKGGLSEEERRRYAFTTFESEASAPAQS